MRVLIVTGDRNATSYPASSDKWGAAMRLAFGAAGEGMASHEAVILIHGACGMDGWSGQMKGIDAIANENGRNYGFIVVPMPARWESFGLSAGPRRNREMIEAARKLRNAGADVFCLAFHDNLNFSKGTKHCVDEARRHGIPVSIWRSDGSVRAIA